MTPLKALTPKQEAFAVAVASGQSQADAYRHAYPDSRATGSVLHVKASQLMADDKVRLRVAELRAPVAAEAQITLRSHLEDLQRLRNMAVKGGQFSAAISAEIARGKAAGIYVEKHEHSGRVEVATKDQRDAAVSAFVRADS